MQSVNFGIIPIKSTFLNSNHLLPPIEDIGETEKNEIIGPSHLSGQKKIQVPKN